MKKLLFENLTYKIIGSAREVYKVLGPGYLESVYEDALCYELDLLGISYHRQVELDVKYKDVIFEKRFRADLLLENKILIENENNMVRKCFSNSVKFREKSVVKIKQNK